MKWGEVASDRVPTQEKVLIVVVVVIEVRRMLNFEQKMRIE